MSDQFSGATSNRISRVEFLNNNHDDDFLERSSAVSSTIRPPTRNEEPDVSSSSDFASRNKLLRRAAKARLGKRAYAQRQKEKGVLTAYYDKDNASDNSSILVGIATAVSENDRSMLSAPEDETATNISVTSSLLREATIITNDEGGDNDSKALTASVTLHPTSVATYSFKNCEVPSETKEMEKKIETKLDQKIRSEDDPTILDMNEDFNKIKTYPTKQPSASSSTAIGGETAVFPRARAYKNAKRQSCAVQNAEINNTGTTTTTTLHPSKTQEEKRSSRSKDINSNRDLSLEPYIYKLERFEFFATLQAYYIVACDKHNSQYRVLRMDRTRMERTAAAKDSTSAEAMSFYGTPSRARNPDNNITNNNIMGGDRDSKTAIGSSNPTTASNNINVTTTGTSSSTTTTAQGQARNTLQRPLADFCHEDSHAYNQEEIQDMLDMIHHGNESVGGLHPVTKAYGIVGIFRFLDCYYLTLITKRIKVGSIAGHSIYTIKQTETYPLKPSWTSSSSSSQHGGGDNINDIIGMTSAVGGGVARANRNNIVPTSLTNAQDPSSMLLSMWNRGKRSVGLGLSPREIAELRYQGLYQVIDLTKNFYFSYTYDMTRSLQENILIYQTRPSVPPQCKEMYCWNWYLARELDEVTSWPWMLPIIHGAYIQRQLHDYGRVLQLILMARRSRHFAGTRYLKRGVSDRGTVANDVEHEQILQDECNSGNMESNSVSGHGVFSSYLQMRGSIPVYWSQESSVTIPKPPIVLNRVDPTYRATQIHFEHLFKRYGSPIVVLDLVKQSEKREREVIVGDEYRHAVDYLNSSITNAAHQIRYCALDYSHISKHRNLNISTSLNEVATWAVNQTGFFCSSPKFKIEPNGAISYFNVSSDAQEAKIWSDTLGVPIFCMEQKGVLRTNCIDCLDRTNVAQFSAGVMALAQQLVVMGIRSSVKLDPSSSIVRVLIDMYVDIGDHLALQYGGSEAHKKGPTAGTSGGTSSDPTTASIGKHKELLTSIRRYYSNAFTDRLKQDAMNLFLGYYIPSLHSVPLWDIQDDFYLHNVHVRLGGISMEAHRQAFGFDLRDDDDESDEAGVVAEEKNCSLQSHGEEERKRENSDPSDRVYRRFKAQEKMRSMWWRVAVQTYIQQRMWMQLIRDNNEKTLPPRFDRIYQTEKLAQFDKLFSRSWAVPVRLSHAAQHSQPDAADICTSHYTKFTNIHKRQNSSLHDYHDLKDSYSSTSSNSSEDRCTIKDFVSDHGLKVKNQSSLAHFLNFRHSLSAAAKDYTAKCDAWLQEPVADISNGVKGKVRQPNSKKDRKSKLSASLHTDEHIRYISEPPQRNSPGFEYLMSSIAQLEPDKFIKHHRSVAISEFAESLYETSLDSNDVDGILRLSKSAHISRVLESGPYRGLKQDESAAQVTHTLFEKYDLFLQKLQLGESPSSSPSRSTSLDGPEYHLNLQKLGYETAGVKETIAAASERFAKSRRAFSEMLQASSLDFKRSDLTTESSLRLYCSMFDDQQASLSQADMSYILGEKNLSLKSESSDSYVQNNISSGSIISHISSWLNGDNRGIPSFANHHSFVSESHAKPGFEQINEDLYARTDNKFLVLNGSGVESWTSHPVTKLGGISQDFFCN